MNRMPLRIGIETRQMAGHMTGIGNYSFHLLRALADDATLDFVGFSDFNWSNVDRRTLSRLGEAQAKTSDETHRRPLPRRYLDRITRRATTFDLARSAYRTSRSFLFGRTVGRQQLDLFHALSFLPPSEPGVETLPTVYDLSHLRHPDSHPRERLRWLSGLGAVIERAPLVHTISEFTKSEIHSAYGYPLDRILVAPPAAAAIFRPLGEAATRQDIAAFGLTPSHYRLAVGTLEPRKNLRTLISAFGRLSPREQQEAPLVIAGGSGWGDIDLPKDASSLIDAGHLRFLGAVSDAHLRSLYEGATALFFPSIYEGFGMPVVEAMSCGTPVVHSSGTSMDEISADLALRVPASDVDAWTDAMRGERDGAFRVDPETRTARMLRAATFSWHASASIVRSAYRTITGR